MHFAVHAFKNVPNVILPNVKGMFIRSQTEKASDVVPRWNNNSQAHDFVQQDTE